MRIFRRKQDPSPGNPRVGPGTDPQAAPPPVPVSQIGDFQSWGDSAMTINGSAMQVNGQDGHAGQAPRPVQPTGRSFDMTFVDRLTSGGPVSKGAGPTMGTAQGGLNGSAVNGQDTGASQARPGIDARPTPQAQTTVLGSDFAFEGTLSGDGTVVVLGRFKGELKAEKVHINEGAAVEGTVIARAVEMSGGFDGQVTAHHVLLRQTARVTGTIEHERIAIEDGAQVQASLRIGPAESVAPPSRAVVVRRAPSRTPAQAMEEADES